MRTDEHVLLFVQASDSEARGDEARTRDHAVNLVAQDAWNDVRRVPEAHVQVTLRVRTLELAERRDEPAHAELETRPNHELERRRLVAADDRAAALGFLQTAPGLREQSDTFRGEPDASRTALEETRAELFFEPVNAVTERRW
jgi:hypothetical protein